MANRAYLLAVADPAVTWSSDPAREVIAEGINEVPVFWASLFTSADRRLDGYEGEPPGTVVQVANWCVDSAVARGRLGRLRGPIAALLDERSAEVWTRWVDHLSAESAPYLKTNAAEVYALDPQGYEGYWATLLQLFAEPSPAALRAAIEANGLRLGPGGVSWDDDEETICKLAGADHIRDVPWLG